MAQLVDSLSRGSMAVDYGSLEGIEHAEKVRITVFGDREYRVDVT